jgi:hypothetical protein
VSTTSADRHRVAAAMHDEPMVRVLPSLAEAIKND